MSDQANSKQTDQQRVARQEDRFQALVTATSDVIYSVSADWETMRELDGRGFVKDFLEPTSNWREVNIYPADVPLIDETIKQAIAQKKIFQLEHRVLRPDGTTGWTFSRAVPILDENGEIIEWFGTASDITVRKEAEEALAITRGEVLQQKRLYETINASTPDLIYVFGLDYRFTYANEALLNMWGKNWDNAVGKSLLENGYEPWHAEMHEREIDTVRDTKKPIRGEVSFPHATLGRRVYDYIFTPIFDDNGDVEAVAGTTRDVTDRKQWEEKLKKNSTELQAINEEVAAINEEQAASNEELTVMNEELISLNRELMAARHQIEESEVALRLAIDAANFGTWFIHSESREFVTDSRLKELFGYYPDEDLSIAQALAQITEEYRTFVATKLENAITNNGDYDVTYPVVGLHDNKLRWLRAIGNLKADPSGTFSAFTGVVMDITDQYLASQKIEEAEEGMRMAIQSGELATWYLNENLDKIVASGRFNEIFGFNEQAEVPYTAAIEQVLPEYRDLVQTAVEASFKNAAPFNVEYPIIGFQDGKQRWIRSVGKVVRDDRNGNYITGVMADITEQKIDELRKNDFIGMVSHELKTPLTSLSAIVQVAELKLKRSDDQFLAGAMTKANLQVRRMTGMINSFLTISRLESGKITIEKSKFDMADLLKEVADEVRVSMVTHVLDLGACESSQVFADRDKINSVVSNLISNAIKYSPRDTTIGISCASANSELIVSVKDQGIGLKASDTERIFERYYRVEGSETSHISGFGIGLYLSAEIIERHGGKVWLESELGKGSTFYFSLPVG